MTLGTTSFAVVRFLWPGTVLGRQIRPKYVLAPGYADEQLDQAFLTAQGDKGISVKSDEFALDLAHSTCDLLNSGATVEAALRQIQSKTKWPDLKSVNLGGLAVYAYCNDKLPP